MNDTSEVKRGPGRPPRAQTEQVVRRRREGMGADRNLKLHVPEDKKDPNFEYRWVNDRPGRVQQLTQGDDYDVVPGVTNEGTTETRIADKSSGERAVLLRKRKEFYESDKREEQKVLDARDEALRRAPPPSAEGLSGPEAYVPGGRNIVGGR